MDLKLFKNKNSSIYKQKRLNLFRLKLKYIGCCGLSQSRYKYSKKDTYSLYDWIIYNQGSKAKEKERKRQAVTREVIYNPLVI